MKDGSYEIALDLIGTAVAERAATLAAERDGPVANADLIARLRDDILELRRLQRALDPRDERLVHAVITSFGAEPGTTDPAETARRLMSDSTTFPLRELVLPELDPEWLEQAVSEAAAFDPPDHVRADYKRLFAAALVDVELRDIDIETGDAIDAHVLTLPVVRIAIDTSLPRVAGRARRAAMATAFDVPLGVTRLGVRPVGFASPIAEGGTIVAVRVEIDHTADTEVDRIAVGHARDPAVPLAYKRADRMRSYADIPWSPDTGSYLDLRWYLTSAAGTEA